MGWGDDQSYLLFLLGTPKNMNREYEHTQFGYVILGAVLGAGLLGWLPTLLMESAGYGFWVSMCVLGIAGLLFSSLTVRITEDKLIWYFGPRFWKNTLPLSAIEQVEPVRISPWNGWGIRMLSDGWLYNVSGLDAVKIETTDGDVIRIGTDEPNRLANTLREAVPASS